MASKKDIKGEDPERISNNGFDIVHRGDIVPSRQVKIKGVKILIDYDDEDYAMDDVMYDDGMTLISK